MTPPLKLALRIAALVAVASCADDEAQFNVKYAPDYARGSANVSILGVFKEGRMAPETWELIGPRISAAFGKASCPIAYDEKLVTTNHELAEAVDDYARANGITDDLLDQLAPAAASDTVLVITVAGRPPSLHADAGAGSSGPTSAPTTMAPGGMGRRGGARGMTPMARAAIDRNAFEMSASLFSVKDHHSVAMVTMGYSGPSANEALDKFVQKLRTSFPGATCGGWRMETKLDDGRIRKMIDE